MKRGAVETRRQPGRFGKWRDYADFELEPGDVIINCDRYEPEKTITEKDIQTVRASRSTQRNGQNKGKWYFLIDGEFHRFASPQKKIKKS